jgi:very-short-patch-repair endonuclease
MYNDQLQKFRRRQLRKNPTEAEKILWQEVRGKKINNLRFHRQYSTGPYILDFFCPKIRLGIELDGEQHKEAKEYDKERKFFLDKAGVHIIRFWNQEVISNLKSVLENITNLQRSLLPPLL